MELPAAADWRPPASQLACQHAEMDLATAREVLGVEAGTAWPEVRARYLGLIRRHHPDAAFDLADSGARTLQTARVTEAFAVVLASQRAQVEAEGVRAERATAERDDVPSVYDAPEPQDGARLRHPSVGADDTRVVVLDAAPMEALLALHECFALLGAVSYIDRLSLVIETIVTPEPARATSLLAWLDPLPDGVTQATFCVESLGGHPAADLDALVDRIATLLASPRPTVRDT
jgi:hypothetical protein